MKIRKEFISSSYNTYVMFVILFIIFISIIYTSYIWFVQKENICEDLHREAIHIEDTLKEIFTETSQLMISVGKGIIGLQQQGENGLENIENLLSKNPEAIYYMGKTIDEKYEVDKTTSNIYYGDIKKFPSWRNLGWIPPHNFLIINPKFGSPSKTIDMSFRNYLKKGKSSPWKLIFSSLDIGIPSGLWEIPAGMSITDKTGKYLGTVSTGFTLSELNSILRHTISQGHISFLILDTQYKIVLQSPDNACNPKQLCYFPVLNEKKFSLNTQGFLETPLLHKDISYLYFQKMQNYPYIIFTGYRDDWLYKNLIQTLIPRLIEFILMGIFCLIILYVFRTQILKMFKNSEKEKGIFLTLYRQKNKNFHESPLLKSLNDDFSNYSHVNVQKVIKECIIICTQQAFLGNFRIIHDISVKKPIYSLYIDEWYFKKIILSLINLSFNFLKEKGLIIISYHLEKKTENQEDFLHIYLEDDGIPVDKLSLIHLQKNFNFQSSIFHDQLEMSFEQIENLVHLQGGTCSVESKEDIGKIIELIFPCKNKKEFVNVSEIVNTFNDKKIFH